MDKKEKIDNKTPEELVVYKAEDIRCPICGGRINWIKVVGNINFSGNIDLLAECWSGDTDKETGRHLFLIKIKEDDLPKVFFRRTSDGLTEVPNSSRC